MGLFDKLSRSLVGARKAAAYDIGDGGWVLFAVVESLLYLKLVDERLDLLDAVGVEELLFANL